MAHYKVHMLKYQQEKLMVAKFLLMGAVNIFVSI